MRPLNPFDGPMTEAKARVVAAVATPDRHPAVYGVGLGKDDAGQPIVTVTIVGDDAIADEVRRLCAPDPISVTFIAGVPRFRKTSSPNEK